jgi:hypothetical protein
MSKFNAALGAIAVMLLAGGAQAAPIIFDDFNINEGHFNLAPSFSGSNLNIAASSTADRDTTAGASVEGLGFEHMVFNPTTAGSAARVRFLSGSGTPSSNTAFTTSAGGVDGFIGFYLKTSTAGWTAQIALDGPLPDLQGGVPKTIIADGEWHLYEWDLDAAAQWTSVASIGGNTTFEQGTQTIDSIVFRHTAAPSSSAIELDFVAKSDSGSIAPLVPEPGTLALLAIAVPAMLRRRRAV